MGQAYPPMHPASRESSCDESPRGRDSAIDISLRELCDLQAHATHPAAAIQSIDNQPSTISASDGAACDEAFIRCILKARLDRNRFLPSHLFADPAWDMLLDLYAAELGQQRVSVCSLCAAANVPATTALRWVASLEREGLVERRPDPLDARRFFLSLSRKASQAMTQYFAETPRFASA